MNALPISLAMGIVVGIAYGLSGIRSPAPPIIALIGLLGIVIGEQGVAMAKAHFAPASVERNAGQNGKEP